ncbi:inorganic triphosphatase YgiF [Psychrobacter sp. PL19]|uniref:CYTH and CHAD domain-containing protein n=1 Tax=Psychrobacter sp. PL19 TaxID=2760711 RepID=UPI001AE5C1BC
MQEIELKFLIPQARLKGLMRQARVKSSQLTHMAAHYYDTSEQDLAQAGIGLRIRQEGDVWVQTIKAGGDGIAARLEHNTILDNEHVQAMLDTNELMPDLTLYKDTAIAPALADFKLKKLAKKLTRQYLTDVARTTRLLIEDSNEENSSKERSTIEVAYDLGQIIHGSDDSQCQDIHEIEFELVSGELAFLFATAKTWCKRYKLCLSTVTKAERGGLLVKGHSYSPAVCADLGQLNVNQHSSRPAFVRAAVHNCLLQILPNSSAIAAGSRDDQHVLQLRIGIRRLQVTLKAFEKFSDQLNAEWHSILKQTAALLGDYRELAHLATTIEPDLRQRGAPSIDWAIDLERIKITPMDTVRANDFQIILLELIEFTMSDPSTEPQANKLAMDKLPKILAKKHIKLLEAEQDFEDFQYNDSKRDGLKNSDLVNSDLEDNSVEQDNLEPSHSSSNPVHKVRRHLKDLRYVSEFAAPLYAKKNSKRWLKRLIKAQKALGQYQDHNYYQQCYQQKAFTDPNALYGAGWFAALLKDDGKRMQKRLARIQDSAMFW